MTRALLAALLVLPLVPAAGAAPYVSDGETEPISSWYSWSPQGQCGVWDPVLGVVEVPTATSLRHAEADGQTRYTLHFAPPIGSDCPTFDLEFTSSVAWPEGGGSISSPCGVSGFFQLFNPGGDTVYVNLNAEIPAACGLPREGSFGFWGSIVQPHPDTAVACTPYSPIGWLCVGAQDGELPWWCGEDKGYTHVWPVLYAGDTCRWDRPGERAVTVSAIVVSASVSTTDETCTVYVYDDFNGGTLAEQPCPEAVRDPLHHMPWGHLIP